jgi:hypothetical protein
MIARQKYGDIQVDSDYRVIEEGKDWVKSSVKGKAIYVPIEVFYGKREAPVYREEEECEDF